MRPHFPSAKPRTASEARRWFICCPLRQQCRVSRFLTPVLWFVGAVIPLSRWQLGKSFCVFWTTWNSVI